MTYSFLKNRTIEPLDLTANLQEYGGIEAQCKNNIGWSQPKLDCGSKQLTRFLEQIHGSVGNDANCYRLKET